MIRALLRRFGLGAPVSIDATDSRRVLRGIEHAKRPDEPFADPRFVAEVQTVTTPEARATLAARLHRLRGAA